MALNSFTTKAVFLDKDGTLIENVPYNADPGKIRLLDGSLDGLKRLSEAGFKLFIVSNQSGVAHGHFLESELEGVKDRLVQLLKEAGVPLADFYYCPHHPDGMVSKYALTCFCRKPSPGLLFRAAREHQLSLADSWMIGDILDDIEAGRRADCRTILLDNGNETVWRTSPTRRPHFTAKNLVEAADAILQPESMPKQDEQQPRQSTVRTIPIKIQSNGTHKVPAGSVRSTKGVYGRKSISGD